MRRIERNKRFDRDYRRELKSQYGKQIEPLLRSIVASLVIDEPLAARHRDHALTGNWRGFRDCHVRPDLVMIYRKVDDDVLELMRLGSHSELRL